MGVGHILVVDDEELIRWSLGQSFQLRGWRVTEAGDGQSALEAIRRDRPSVMLLDLQMPGMGGLDLLREMKAADLDVPTLVLTADGRVDSAVEATRLGARTYLTKPFDLEEVGRAVERVLADDAASREVLYEARGDRPGYGDFVGAAPALKPVFSTLQRLEKVDAPTVLVLGESGTGKDVVARMIHTQGPRRRGPFLDIDCASLPPALIESELFGHEKGAFTDARDAKKGLFEAAAGGVVFLDEIGELPLEVQAKLLKALENRSFRRVGGLKPIPFDAALVAATNRDLAKEAAAGRFREDLYFRLAVVPIRLPSLRDRREDVPSLVAHFVDRCNHRFGRRIKGVAGDAMALLQRWTWPGNVRELRNVIERIAILSTNDVIGVDDLPPEIRYARPVTTPDDARTCVPLPDGGLDLDAVEHGFVVQALERSGDDVDGAARLLRITPDALRARMERLGLPLAPTARA